MNVWVGALLVLFAFSVFLLVIVTICLDEAHAENNRLRDNAARRILELEKRDRA